MLCRISRRHAFVCLPNVRSGIPKAQSKLSVFGQLRSLPLVWRKSQLGRGQPSGGRNGRTGWESARRLPNDGAPVRTFGRSRDRRSPTSPTSATPPIGSLPWPRTSRRSAAKEGREPPTSHHSELGTRGCPSATANSRIAGAFRMCFLRRKTPIFEPVDHSGVVCRFRPQASLATTCTGSCSAAASMTCARSTCLRDRLRSATIASSICRSDELRTTHTVSAMSVESHARRPL